MVAAVERIDRRRATKLPHHEHDRRFKEVAVLQIADERGQRRIEELRLGGVAGEVAGMGVEALKRDLDAPHSRLDEPPGDEAPPSEIAVAVEPLDRFRLAVEIEGSELLRGHEGKSLTERVLVERAPHRLAPTGLKRPRQRVERAEPARLAVHRDVRDEILPLLPRREHPVGIELIAEIAAARGELRPPQRDESRELEARRRKLVGSDRPESRMDGGRVGTVAGLHGVLTALVVSLLRHQRPDEGKAIENLRQPGIVGGDPHVGDDRGNVLRRPSGGMPGMGIKGLQLARAAGKPHDQERPGPLAATAPRRPGRKRRQCERQPK